MVPVDSREGLFPPFSIPRRKYMDRLAYEILPLNVTAHGLANVFGRP